MKKAVYILLVLIAVVGAYDIWRHHHQPVKPGGSASQTATDRSSTPATPTFDKTKFSTTDPASPWVVVNKQHPLEPRDYAPSDLTSIGNGQYLRAEAAQNLNQMLADARTAGFTVTPASGYRSYATQVSVYNSEVKAYGQATADSESARPGYSEHQTGWALDLASGGCNIQDCFGDTPGGKWVTANAYKYGFILRYPAGLEQITGYRTETWHFRYIGIDLATEMHAKDVATLEQFFNVSGGPDYK